MTDVLSLGPALFALRESAPGEAVRFSPSRSQGQMEDGMSDLAKLIALVQFHGLEGWTLADTHRLKKTAEQHAAQLRKLTEAAKLAHSAMRTTVAPNNAFTDALDALDAALTGAQA